MPCTYMLMQTLMCLQVKYYHVPSPAYMLSCLSHVRLCDPMDHSPPASSVHGFLQARILERVAMPSSGDLANPGIKLASLTSPALSGGFFFFTTSAAWEAPVSFSYLINYAVTDWVNSGSKDRFRVSACF